jgi:hypothetical protein
MGVLPAPLAAQLSRHSNLHALPRLFHRSPPRAPGNGNLLMGEFEVSVKTPEN